ncbi:3'-5' exonuclease [bacterium]|nr:3'-5' exonuclease [bacterium]
MSALRKPCPSCGTVAVVVSGGVVRCQHCGVSHACDCPVCDAPHSQMGAVEDGVQCGQCRQVIRDRLIAQLIDNALMIDPSVRCEYCGSPTVRRRQGAFGNRCLFFPACSGQAGLFSTPQESYVFLDFETTGLEIGRDCLLEVGAVKVGADGDESFYQSFIRPTGKIPAKITTITGIDEGMVADAPTLQVVLSELIPFIGDARLVIHNADFDMPWLLVSMLRHGYECPGNTVTCTLKWARASGESQGSLGALTRKYHIHNPNAHRALADASATRELFFIFEQRAKPARPQQYARDYWPMATEVTTRYHAFVQA